MCDDAAMPASKRPRRAPDKPPTKAASPKAATAATAAKAPEATPPVDVATLLKPTECLPYLINVITNYVNESMLEDLRRAGMTVPRWTVLTALRDEDGLAIGDLSERCMIRQSSLTRVVDQLQRDGHVRRRAKRGDLRVVQVFITKAGNALYESVVPGALERASNEIRSLLSTEVDALAEVLERAAAALKGKKPARSRAKSASRKTSARPRTKTARAGSTSNRPMA
jgi:DNA-binding MarR family transcriptional regulator